MSQIRRRFASSSSTAPATTIPAMAGLAALAATATALWVRSRARRAEREHPPRGRFIEVDGVRLHYLERGDRTATGPAVVLLHGNAVSLEDFEASGLLDALAREHRVIAFDRPGFGHSSRPRDRVWTPAAQAELLHRAMQQLDVGAATVVGHSMGTTVALALALDHPGSVAALVLLGGYYYLTPRLDAALLAPIAMPVVGDVLRYTVAAVASRAMIGATVKAMFAPLPVPDDFFPTLSREMMLRPSQIGADVEDGVLLLPAARENAARYGELRMPVTLIAGAGDKIVDADTHSVCLHDDIGQSELAVLPGVGHMVHYAAQKQILAAIDRSATGGQEAESAVLGAAANL